MTSYLKNKDLNEELKAARERIALLRPEVSSLRSWKRDLAELDQNASKPAQSALPDEWASLIESAFRVAEEAFAEQKASALEADLKADEPAGE